MRRIKLFCAWMPYCAQVNRPSDYTQASRVNDLIHVFKRAEVNLL